MRKPIEPGMDHGHYAISPMPAWPPLQWPGAARLAFFVVVHVEDWELAPPQDAHRDPRFVRRGDEIVAHGRHATRMITSKLTPARKQAEIVDALDTPECVTGTRPTGWFSQDCGESAHTPQLPADAGLDYVLD